MIVDDILNNIYILFVIGVILYGILLSIIVYTSVVDSCAKVQTIVALLFLFPLFYTFMIFKKMYYIDREKNSFFIFTSKKNYPDYYVEWGQIDTTNNLLINYHIASAYKPYIIGGTEYDIVSLKHIHKTLLQGARCHYLEIDSSNQDNMLDIHAYPIIHIPHLLKKPITLEDVFSLYTSKAWIGTDYPLILFLDCKRAITYNKFILKKLGKIIEKHFKDICILGKDINDITIEEAFRKIIICTNIDFKIYKNKINFPGFDSHIPILQKYTNGYIQTELPDEYNGFDIYKNSIHFQKNDVIEYNKNKCSMIVPETIKTSFTNIIHPGNTIKQIPISSVSQYKYTFNFIYYHHPGKNNERKEYIQFFKKCSFIKKY